MKYLTSIQILANYEREINKFTDNLKKPSTDDSLYWLNQAVAKFVKERFNGNAPHYTSYEQNEKRARDLINLHREVNVAMSKQVMDDYIRFEVVYPDDFMFTLNEDVVIQSIADPSYKLSTCVFECTADTFMYRINNALTDFHYRHKHARPLRIRTQNGCYLLTDGKYNIYQYTLGYLKQPNEISLDKPFEEYQDFPDYIMLEIIKIAAQMYIENQKDQRYQTITNEVNTQE